MGTDCSSSRIITVSAVEFGTFHTQRKNPLRTSQFFVADVTSGFIFSCRLR
jgi:hypothetical protein